MAEGDAEIVPPNKVDRTVAPHIVINQFFQLVNQNNTMPDGKTLDSYQPEDKEWIKERVNFEQEQRLALFHKYMDHQNAMEAADNLHEHQNTRHLQWGAFGIVGLSVVAAAVLIYLKAGFVALGLPAIVLIPGVASGIFEFVSSKIKPPTKDDKIEKS